MLMPSDGASQHTSGSTEPVSFAGYRFPNLHKGGLINHTKEKEKIMTVSKPAQNILDAARPFILQEIRAAASRAGASTYTVESILDDAVRTMDRPTVDQQIEAAWRAVQGTLPSEVRYNGTALATAKAAFVAAWQGGLQGARA